GDSRITEGLFGDSLDLNDASKEQRNDLYGLLAAKNWMKTKDVDTVWTLTYPDFNHDSEENMKAIRLYLESTLCNAAQSLRLKEIYYVAQLGNDSVLSRVVKKVEGVYKALPTSLYATK
ncbi:hypothetical protein, partial [Pseudomonas monteilii]|uniref:hypothetical protein n=5 Tax=Pseudomonas TaxID=286 RepID=UPI000B138E33